MTEGRSLLLAFSSQQPYLARLVLSSLFGVLLLAASALASAAPVRTFVASTGSDSNPCSRVAPCRTFQAAVNAAAAGGEVVALDSAGFGSNVTINKAISVIAPAGVYAGVTVFSGDGIDISAGPSDAVTLQGLTVISQGTSGNGIVFSAGRALHIQDCVIAGFGVLDAKGILQTAGQLLVKDTVVKNCVTGVDPSPVPHVSIAAAMDNLTITANLVGLVCFADIAGQVQAAITRSSISGNSAGVSVEANNGGTALLDIESCLIANNSFGVLVDTLAGGGTAAASISNCVISHNSMSGFQIQGGAAILSRGNNTIIGNGANTGSLTPFAGQ